MNRNVLAMLLTGVLCFPSFPETRSVENVPDSGNSGHLKLDSMYVDLGDVDQDKVAEAVMRFRNTGNAPFSIIRIFSDCGCTVPSYPTDPVLPDSTGDIRIRFDGRKRQPGSFRKVLRIRSDADNEREILTVKGKVVKHN